MKTIEVLEIEVKKQKENMVSYIETICELHSKVRDAEDTATFYRNTNTRLYNALSDLQDAAYAFMCDRENEAALSNALDAGRVILDEV